jgi:hypothetical protein
VSEKPARLAIADTGRKRLNEYRSRSCRTTEKPYEVRAAPTGLCSRPGWVRPIYQEYQVGDFECEFTLSGDFDPDRIEAGLNEGVLRLTIPRAEQAAAGTIKITARE